MEGKGKVRKIGKLILTIVFTVGMVVNSTSSAFATAKTSSATYSGHELQCTLTTSWSLIGNDTATAKTYMKRWNGYQAKVKLQQCQNIASKYYTMDTDFGDTTAIVRGSKSGVWKFKSYHAVYSKSKKDATRVCTLTDW